MEFVGGFFSLFSAKHVTKESNWDVPESVPRRLKPNHGAQLAPLASLLLFVHSS